MPRGQRTSAELRDLSVHVLWHVRQLCRLGAHLKQRGAGEGTTELVDPLDAAALEAFLVHARALIEFLWRDAAPSPPRRAPRDSDGLAADYFPEGGWPPLDEPEVLREQANTIGWGVLHVSYKRLEPAEAWHWDHAKLALGVYGALLLFCERVNPDLVTASFRAQVDHEFREHLGIKTPRDVGRFGLTTQPVATPGHAAVWMVDEPGPAPEPAFPKPPPSMPKSPPPGFGIPEKRGSIPGDTK